MKNKKGNVAVIVIIIAVVALAAGIISWKFAKKSPAPIETKPTAQPVPQNKVTDESADLPATASATEGWQTYRNEKYGFEFKYPKDFYDIGELDGLYAYQKYFSNKQINGDFNKIGPSDVQLSLMVSKNEKESNNEEELRQIKAIEITVSEVKNITIGNLSAIQQLEDATELKNTDGGCSLSSYFKKNGISHQIKLFSPGSCDTIKKFENNYNQILSTFKFIN